MPVLCRHGLGTVGHLIVTHCVRFHDKVCCASPVLAINNGGQVPRHVGAVGNWDLLDIFVTHKGAEAVNLLHGWNAGTAACQGQCDLFVGATIQETA